MEPACDVLIIYNQSSPGNYGDIYRKLHMGTPRDAPNFRTQSAQSELGLVQRFADQPYPEQRLLGLIEQFHSPFGALLQAS